MQPKFMGTEGYTWFLGVVEDNRDPAYLGRVRVRCYGYHTDNKTELPTDFLPWAVVVQPTTSAGLAGVGTSPTGLLVGSQVIGFFADGVNAQIPLVTGVVGGVNTQRAVAPESLAIPAAFRQGLSGNTNQSNTSPQQAALPIPAAPSGFALGALGSLTQADITQLKAAIGRRESNNNYRAENQFGFIGKYQFGALLLIDLGFVNSTFRTNSSLNADAAWRGKYGVTSKQGWLTNGLAQEQAMDEALRYYFQQLTRRSLIEPSTDPRVTAGYMAVVHLLGLGGATRFRQGQNGTDANGTSARSYYNLGYNSITRQVST